MGCGCKKKKINPAPQPRTINNVMIVEGRVVERPIVSSSPPPAPTSDVESVLNKLNDILKPD